MLCYRATPSAFTGTAQLIDRCPSILSILPRDTYPGKCNNRTLLSPSSQFFLANFSNFTISSRSVNLPPHSPNPEIDALANSKSINTSLPVFPANDLSRRLAEFDKISGLYPPYCLACKRLFFVSWHLAQPSSLHNPPDLSTSPKQADRILVILSFRNSPLTVWTPLSPTFPKTGDAATSNPLTPQLRGSSSSCKPSLLQTSGSSPTS